MQEHEYKLVEIVSGHPFVLYYQGNYKENPALSVVDIVEENLALHFKRHLVKKLSYLVVEAVQNIERYSEGTVSSEDFSLIFSDTINFHIITENRIENKNIASLKNRLDIVNSKHSEELNQLYLDSLKSDERTSKGAGLGLIDLARKSKNHLAYEFDQKSEEYSSYRLHIKIPLTENNSADTKEESNNALIAVLSSSFREDKSAFFYRGDFSNNFLRALLNMLNTVKKTEKTPSNSLFQYTLIELEQNMRQHGTVVEDEIPGFLCLEWKKENIRLSTFNLISDESSKIISSKINKLNGATVEELKKLNQECLADENAKGGLGLIDVALLSRPNKIEYSLLNDPKLGSCVYVKTEVNYG